MRVLLAIDGSPSSHVAASWVRSMPWPAATRIRIVAVVEPRTVALAGMSAVTATQLERDEVVPALELALRTAAEEIAAPDRIVDATLRRGRPASSVLEEATDFRADLVVVGSRGLGPIRSMVLGSVSAEIVDQAPCPVVVAREPGVRSILLAVDGSPTAQRAVEYLAGGAYLHGRDLEVLSVGHGPAPSSVAPSASDREARRRVEDRAAAAATRLQADGLDARWSIAFGDPAHEILAAAHDLGCDLIVLGSRGLTGLDRVLLGSVARNVLLHADASVMIVREPIRERAVRGHAVPSPLSAPLTMA